MMQEAFKDLFQQLNELESKIDWLTLNKNKISHETIRFVEDLLNIKMNPLLIELFTTYDGCFIGLDIFSLKKCVLNTLFCQRTYIGEQKKKLKNSLVVSDDGSGNPILVHYSGTIYVLHHDDTTYETLDKPISCLFQEYIEYLNKVKIDI